MSEVESFINEATVEGTLQQEKLATMLQQVSEGVERITESAADSSLDDLMAELDSEAASGQISEPAVQDTDLTSVMDELDAAAAKGAEAARKIRSKKEPENPEQEA